VGKVAKTSNISPVATLAILAMLNHGARKR